MKSDTMDASVLQRFGQLGAIALDDARWGFDLYPNHAFIYLIRPDGSIEPII